MGQALYRKYRSKSLTEVLGQEHITTTLARAIKQGKISHAYLFTGPKGVGKTSIARILAHEINGLPYTDESIHLDIIEIDAASNRRIDEIRDLRDKVHIAPTSAKYKVYIIDEVHMLTKEAFNALLKTLEEPPAHVIFILATTELHKLPETIISRTQRFTFKPITEADAVKHMRSIAKSEGIQIDDDALQLLAQHGKGSFRDSISLLDQVGNSSSEVVSRADAESLIGIAADKHISALFDAVIHGKPSDIVVAIEKIIDDGISPNQVAKQLSAKIRALILDGSGNTVVLTASLEQLLRVSSSPDPTTQLELSLFSTNSALKPAEAPRAAQPLSTPAAIEHPVPKPAAPKATTARKPVEQKQAATSAVAQDSTPEPAKDTETKESTAATTPAAPAMPVGTPAGEWWPKVLASVKTINNTLYGILRMAAATVEDDKLTLAFKFSFHQKKITDAATQAKIHDAIMAITGGNMQIIVIHDKDAIAEKITESSPAAATSIANLSNPELSSITNIFGGGEVLES